MLCQEVAAVKVRLNTGIEIDDDLARSVCPGDVPEGDFIGAAWRGEQLYRYYRDKDGKLQYRSYPEFDPRRVQRGGYRRQ